MPVTISRKVHYYNFGFIPNGNWRHDLTGKVFGHFNLLKRLQAKDIIRALDIREDDIVLDFGCGSGYFTVEIAKLAKKAYGIDINSFVDSIPIPTILKGRLQFIRTSGINLPFADNYFDRILASEILPMIDDPNDFLMEIKRVLKPGGHLTISNGIGHPMIKKAFENNPFFMKLLKKIYKTRMPESYDEYCAILQKIFGTCQRNFIKEQNICAFLTNNNFKIESIDYTPGHLAGIYFSWSQFMSYLRTGKPLSQRYFIPKHLFFSLIRRFEERKYQGGFLCIARKII